MKKNKIQKVSIVMGSQSDYKTMKFAEKTLKKIVISFETKILFVFFNKLFNLLCPPRGFFLFEKAGKHAYPI